MPVNCLLSFYWNTTISRIMAPSFLFHNVLLAHFNLFVLSHIHRNLWARIDWLSGFQDLFIPRTNSNLISIVSGFFSLIQIKLMTSSYFLIIRLFEKCSQIQGSFCFLFLLFEILLVHSFPALKGCIANDWSLLVRNYSCSFYKHLYLCLLYFIHLHFSKFYFL